MKRLISLMMALMLVVTALSGLAINVAAAEDDVYVLNYDGAYEGSKWQYFSPYWPAFKLDGVDDYTQSISFTLYDTRNAEPFWTYCTDLEVGLTTDSDFRRINLEDSTYAGAAAGVLRSIVLKGFPNVPVEELGKAAGVEGLTVGEAVAATQAAIWQIAHGDRVEFTDFCRTIDTEWTPGVTAHYDACNAEIENGYAAAENEATIEANIQKVFNYLTNLEATAPTGVVVSESSFVEWDSVITDNGDGTANITATATVDVNMVEGDTLTLSAAVGTYTASTALNDGKNDYTLVIENIPANVADDAVTLAIEGVQAASDVYLFDAIGARGTSQSLIGITDNALPVYAAVNANDRILILNKHDDGVGLQNIVFDIYYVCSVEEYWNGEVSIGTTVVDGEEYFAVPSEADIAKYTQGLPVATITTDASGKASFNFGNNNDGIYLVVERENAITEGAVNPFFVALPGGAMVEDTDKYIVEVAVKNTVKDEDVIIEKDVTEIDNDWSTYDIGEIHTWIIQSSIPTGMATGLKYEITDTLNYQLTYVGNVVVTVSEKTAKAGEDLLVLKEGEDYILTVTPDTEVVNGVEEAITSFKVALTKTGMEKVAAVEGTEPELRVYFDAYIDEDAIIATEIPNQAHISYENNVGVDFDKDSDIPVVITGAGQLLKVDASNHGKKLAGATFYVYREATAEEIADDSVVKETITITEVTTNADGEEIKTLKDLTVVRVSFYDTPVITEDTVKVDKVVSDANGKGTIYGLAYGTYYLVETEAPDGYNLLTEPVKMVIDANSYTDAEVVTIYNAAGFQLPSTGGEGTGMFMIGGIVIIAAAMMLIVVPKKKNA